LKALPVRIPALTYGKVTTINGVCVTLVGQLDGLEQERLCCGAAMRINSVSVEVLMMEMFPS
jgi:hypothetical protein